MTYNFYLLLSLYSFDQLDDKRFKMSRMNSNELMEQEAQEERFEKVSNGFGARTRQNMQFVAVNLSHTHGTTSLFF